MKRRVVIVVLIIFCFEAFAQDQGKLMFLDIKLHSGSHLYTGDRLTEFLEYGYGAGEVRIGWQTRGKNDWEHEYNFPYYGLGWYTGAIGNPEILGQPQALYGFFGFTIGQHKRHKFTPELALGLTYDLANYDPVDNPYNDAIGARAAVYFNLNFGFNWALNRELDFIYGLDMTHFSNGRSFQPNFGLNMLGINLGIRYHFNSAQKEYSPGIRPENLLSVRPDYSKVAPQKKRFNENNILLTTAFGTSQNQEDAGTDNRHFNFSGILDYQHFFNLKHGFTAGLDFFYDESLEPRGDEPEMIGSHLGYDFRFWRLTVRLQFGTYLSAPESRMGSMYMRPGINYAFTDRLFGHLALKTQNGAAADWVEFGIGYALFHKRKVK